ncbi:hypothetical protein QMA51_05555 [Leuconostoc suionicum]|uniref:hypothetical protein n=1 Tax=Leuconostoc suionicum TaxID=1511761 RepID=UPI0024AD6774|nr:hypothetical protein [Leuconostoc suionicum]MDI6551118.1 hypothetical protein [Leuconostoc suionicum]
MTKKKYLLLVGLIACGTILVVIGSLFIHTNHKTAISRPHSSISTKTGKKVASSSSVSKATSSITSSSSTQQASSSDYVATSSFQQNNTDASNTNSGNVSTDTNTLTGFINTYGMTPSSYKMKQGMSAEEALKSVPDTMKTSGEIQTEYLTYGIQSVADDGTVTMSK